MNRFLLGLGGIALGVILGFWLVSSQISAMNRSSNSEKPNPAEDPRNAIVGPEKIHPVTADLRQGAKRFDAKQAPDFTLNDENGTAHTLSDMAKSKPVLLFFIVDSCPCCVTARPYIDRVQNVYKDVLTVVGVINADTPVARQWAKNNSANFPLLIDPSLKTIRAYDAKRGTYMALIAPGGTIDKMFPGYSQALVRDLSARIARLAGVPVRTVEVADLPKEDTTGCPFDSAPSAAKHP